MRTQNAKRLFPLLLVFSLLVFFAACQKETVEELETLEPFTVTEEEIETTQEKIPKNTDHYKKILSPAKLEDLEAIPIAKEGMTTDELRQICVDYFNLAVSFPYIPDSKYDYRVASQGLDRTLTEGEIYGGLPYITDGGGNLYRLFDFYDTTTGILDMSLYLKNPLYFGNACSGGAAWAWARVVNSVKSHQYTVGMCESNGYLKLGPYEYDVSQLSLDSPSPSTICRNNGIQKMCESYAAALPADGIVSDGHVRMVTQKAHVVRLPDGQIDAAASYLVCTDQICYNSSSQYTVEQEDGSTYQIAGGKNIKYSFRTLFATGYIPFTFAEFLGTDPIEEANPKLLNMSGEPVGKDASLKTLSLGFITANYMVSDTYVTVCDKKGKILYESAQYGKDFHQNTWGMANSFPRDEVEEFLGKGNTIEIRCQLGNGERITVYKGALKN